MTLNELNSKLIDIKKGTFTRIVYTTEPTLTAAARKQGISVVKKTEKVVRLGVNYNNIAVVRAAEAARTEPKHAHSPWCNYVIENVLAKHNTKEDYYLSIVCVNGGHHTKTSWFIDGKEVTRDEVEASGYVTPSYFKVNGEAPVVQLIKLSNIISLGK